jgi:hypothetical protein
MVAPMSAGVDKRSTASDSLECPPTSETSIGVSCGKYVVTPPVFRESDGAVGQAEPNRGDRAS